MIYLYIKQHSITGLKYLGKTVRLNPYSYLGSGKYWLRHINKHGKEHIKTIQIWEFDSQEECTEFALKFSKENNIVESEEWANLIEENGLDGRPVGAKLSEESKKLISRSKMGVKSTKRGVKRPPLSETHKQNISKSNKGKTSPNKNKILSDEHKRKIANSLTGKVRPAFSDEHKRKMSIAKSGVKRPPLSDEHKRKLSNRIKGMKYKTNNLINKL